MKWRIKWSHSAIKDMKRLDNPVRKRIWEGLNSLTTQPETVDIKRLKGNTNEFRLRIGDWRIRFLVDYINKTYLITHIKHRGEIYKVD